MSNVLKPIEGWKVKYKGKVIEIVNRTMSDGENKVVFEMARRAPGVRIIFTNKDSILLSKEFRYEINDYDYRLPGGKVFDKLADYNNYLEAGGAIEKAALGACKREALEEVGVVVKNPKLIYVSKVGTTVEWDLYYFLVTEFDKAGGQSTEVGESIEVTWVKKSEILNLIKSGKMHEDRSVGVLARFIL